MKCPLRLLSFLFFQSVTAQSTDITQQLIEYIRLSELTSWKTLADILSITFDSEKSSQSSTDDHYESARKKAVHWISSDEYALALVNDASADIQASEKKRMQLLQRYALATIYYSTLQNGEWDRCDPLSSTPCDKDDHRYLSTANHLSWEGINGKSGLVTWLDLNSKHLSNCNLAESQQHDMLPLELTLLSSSLELMWLHSNPLCGTIPSYIGEFTNLQSLSLYSTKMSGTVPNSLYRLDKLASIRLYKSNFGGSISQDIGSMKNLKWLWLHENEFTGSVPNLRSLTALEGITLHGNNFTDVENGELCKLLKGNLKYLWTDCKPGSLMKKGEEWVAVTGNKACECCTRCFPKKDVGATAFE